MMHQLSVVERCFTAIVSAGRILRGFVRSVNLHRSGSDRIPKLESWNMGLYLLVTIMRTFVVSHSRDLQTLRAVTDFPLIPTIPRGAVWTHMNIEGVHTEMVWPLSLGQKPPLSNHRVILYLHGGGGALCTSESHRWLTHGIAVRGQAVVVVPNYRRVPEVSLAHSVDDAITLYKYLLETVGSSDQIGIAGDSAGGTLTVLTLCRIRDLGLPMPACGALLSPWCDISQVPKIASPVDYLTRDVIEFMMSLIEGSSREFGCNVSELNPMEVSLSRFPPMMIQLGEAELFADQIRALSKRFATGATLKEYQEMVHIPHFFSFLSTEGDRALSDLGIFLRSSIHS